MAYKTFQRNCARQYMFILNFFIIELGSKVYVTGITITFTTITIIITIITIKIDSGENLNPILDNIVRVDQRITKDFIQFLKSASLEMEVFGKKKPHLKIDEGMAILLGSPHDNDIYKEMEKREKQMKKDQGIGYFITIITIAYHKYPYYYHFYHHH